MVRKSQYDLWNYVESLKDYVRIHTADTRVVTKERISEFEHQLPAQFLRIHRSYIVNLEAVTAYSSHEMELPGVSLPIGISYKELVMGRLG